ncbi:MAG TPA: hypothetical protein VEO54_15780 [Thermoanaerobaculia bacterium]|nr:hypothetical protein [Thermoanaerobaculia bacterium]
MRADLLALTPESLAALANAGLVKRAQKELQQGKAPAIAEDGGGAVTGTFEDGAVARLLPGVPLRDCPCSCGATGTCRHRVATALAYQAANGSAAAPAAPWSPGAIADDSLRARLGARTFDRALQKRAAGVIEIRRDAVPSAHLSTCTVRFLVAGDLAHASCDCEARHDCEHLALAVWAFREADAKAPDARSLIVELPSSGASVQGPGEALDEAVSLAADVIVTGVVNTTESMAQRFALAKRSLAARGLTWPLTAIKDLEESLAAYRSRSSRFHPSDVAEVLAELYARRDAVRRGGEVPARAILGEGEALETRLDLARLVGLGVRVEADGRDRHAEVYLADPQTAAVLVLRKRFAIPESETPPDAAALASRRVASGVTLSGAATGQIVTRVARRMASRVVVLGESRGGATSVVPQAGEWEQIPAPLRVSRFAELKASWSARAPRFLRPRIVAEDVHILEVAAVTDVAYLPGSQSLVATLVDDDGDTLELSKAWRAVAPRALDVWGALLLGRYGRVRYLSGEIQRGPHGFEVSPLAAVADRFLVPELEKECPAAEVPTGRAAGNADGLSDAASAAVSVLEALAHHGLRYASSAIHERVRTAMARLESAGLTTSAERLRALSNACAEAQSNGEPESWRRAADAWATAAMRLELVMDQLSGAGAG